MRPCSSSRSSAGRSVKYLPDAVERAPDRQAILDGLIEQALGQTHGKMARDLAASQTVVIGTHRRPSAWGLVFAIDTTHVTPEGITAVSGFHVVPFEKPYAIALLPVSRGASTRAASRRRGAASSIRSG